jgi:hypothetical protein
MKNLSFKFYYSQYLVSDIEKMIASSPGIQNFVFSFYSEEPTGYLQLIAYGQMKEDGGKSEYSTFTDTLKPFRNQALEINGPVIISNNYISMKSMQLLIGSDAPDDSQKPDYLVFIPGLDSTNHVYYTVTAHQTHPDGDKEDGTEVPPVVTNPSPPATMPVS